MVDINKLRKEYGQGFPGVPLLDLEEEMSYEEFTEFRQWFGGKTGGVSNDGKLCIYLGDLERFNEIYTRKEAEKKGPQDPFRNPTPVPDHLNPRPRIHTTGNPDNPGADRNGLL